MRTESPLGVWLIFHIARWDCKTSGFDSQSHDFNKHDDGRITLRIRFPFENQPSPYLETMAYPIANPKQGSTSKSTVLGIVPDEGPKDDQIYNWLDCQTAFEDNDNTEDIDPDFESYLKRLLRDSIAENNLEQAFIQIQKTPGLIQVPTSETRVDRFIVKQKEILKKIQSMRYMWKLWSSEAFDIRNIDERSVSQDFDVSAIDHHLRLAAQKALSSLEASILNDLERYYIPPMYVKSPALQSLIKVSMWIALWHMVLLYRQCIIRTLGQLELGQNEDDAQEMDGK